MKGVGMESILRSLVAFRERIEPEEVTQEQLQEALEIWNEEVE